MSMTQAPGQVHNAPPAMETWKNAGDSTIVVVKRGEYGIEVEERVGPRAPLYITPADRRLNQQRTVDARHDVFTNGMLIPVELVEGEKGNDTLTDNPNVLSEDQMVALVSIRKVESFLEALEKITNPIVLMHLLEIAQAEDASMSRFQAINARLAETREINTVETKKFAPGPDGPVPV